MFVFLRFLFKLPGIEYSVLNHNRLHDTSILGNRLACTLRPGRNPPQLAAIHEMRKSIMHLIPLSVDQSSVSQRHSRSYKHCISLPSTLYKLQPCRLHQPPPPPHPPPPLHPPPSPPPHHLTYRPVFFLPRLPPLFNHYSFH